MEQKIYLIDSNAIIDYLGKKLPFEAMAFMSEIIDTVPQVSVISKIEVLGFNAPREHYQLLEDFMNDVIVIDLSPDIVDMTITIRRSFKTKLPDAVIAATAVVNNWT